MKTSPYTQSFFSSLVEGRTSKENVCHVESNFHVATSKSPHSASWNGDPIKYQQIWPISHILLFYVSRFEVGVSEENWKLSLPLCSVIRLRKFNRQKKWVGGQSALLLLKICFDCFSKTVYCLFFSQHMKDRWNLYPASPIE